MQMRYVLKYFLSKTSVMLVKEITKTFLSGRISATLIIPIEMARRHGLEQPAHVIIEEIPQGSLIRKLTYISET